MERWDSYEEWREVVMTRKQLARQFDRLAVVALFVALVFVGGAAVLLNELAGSSL